MRWNYRKLVEIIDSSASTPIGKGHCGFEAIVIVKLRRTSTELDKTKWTATTEKRKTAAKLQIPYRYCHLVQSAFP